MEEPKRQGPAAETPEVGLLCAIRFRPLKASEGRIAWDVNEAEGSVSLATTTETTDENPGRRSSTFRFDAVFGAERTTEEVYDRVAREIVDGVTKGVNGTVFAYGQTSSGKTFTMQAGSKYGSTQRGVIALAAEQIFRHIETKPDHDFLLRCSYLEVYNEQLRDMLGSNSQPQLRENPTKGVFVDGAVEEIVTDAAGIAALVAKGEAARAVGSTAMNERSSRSHTVFRIVVESKARGDDATSGVLVGALSLVDLAGSESVRHTGATGQRAKEGGKINQSLLTLSRVIKQLGDKSEAKTNGGAASEEQQQPFVNFRDSKLTRLLQPTLSGDARLAMICCAAPAGVYVEETRSTLQFARGAARVKLAPKIHEILDDASQLRRVKRELAALQKKLKENEASGGGKTEELSRLLDANNQLSAALHDKENALETQVGMIDKLKHMIVLGGTAAPVVAAPLRRHKRARETWAPGAFAPNPLLLSAPPQSRLGRRPSLLDEDDAIEEAIDDEEQKDDDKRDSMIDRLDQVANDDDDGENKSKEEEAPEPPRTTTKQPSAAQKEESPARARLNELTRRSASQLSEERAKSEAMRARAEKAERALEAVTAVLRAEKKAGTDDCEKRGLLGATDAAAGEKDEEEDVRALCCAVRSRREKLAAAVDDARDERAAAQREAYVLKQEVVELREMTEGFDAHVVELEAETQAARDEAGEANKARDELMEQLETAKTETNEARTALSEAERANAAALKAVAEAERANADDRDAAIQRRAAAVEAAERQVSDLEGKLADFERSNLRSLDEVDKLQKQVHRLREDIHQKDTALEEARTDLAAKEARIQRLDQVKMTTDIFKRIQHMQLEKARADGENRELRHQVQLLESQLRGDLDNRSPTTKKHLLDDDDSPLRCAAEALSRSRSSPSKTTTTPSNLATQLQLNELAKRNADLAAQLAETSERLTTMTQLAADVAKAVLGPTFDNAGLFENNDLVVPESTVVDAVIKHRDAAVASFEHRIAAAEKSKLAAMTPAGRRATADKAGLQEKIDFLEGENLQLMIEIKNVRTANAKHKALADDLKAKLLKLQKGSSDIQQQGQPPRSSLPIPPKSSSAGTPRSRHTPKHVAFTDDKENLHSERPTAAGGDLPDDGPGECRQS